MVTTFTRSAAFRRVMLPLGAGLLAFTSLAHGSARAEPAVFIINPQDGYGTADCLSSGGMCGRMAVDSWCSAHGYGKAGAFGLASDITGPTGGNHIAPGAIIVSCKD
jgi:hypothetical protein